MNDKVVWNLAILHAYTLHINKYIYKNIFQNKKKGFFIIIDWFRLLYVEIYPQRYRYVILFAKYVHECIDFGNLNIFFFL